MSAELKPQINLHETDYLVEFFGVSRATLWRWRKDGTLGYYLIAGKPKYSDKHIQEALDRMEKSKPQRKSNVTSLR